MKLLNFRSTKLASLLSATALSAGLIITGGAASPANAASCSVKVGFYNGGYSKAISCSASRYHERVGNSYIYGPKKAKGYKSTLTACYANYKWSGATVWA